MASLSTQKTAIASQQTRAASTEHAISNPTLASIEKRWEAMPPQEQAELWMQLRDRMKVNWHDLTLQEKKAGMCFQNREEKPANRRRLSVTLGCDLCLLLTASSLLDRIWSSRPPC